MISRPHESVADLAPEGLCAGGLYFTYQPILQGNNGYCFTLWSLQLVLGEDGILRRRSTKLVRQDKLVMVLGQAPVIWLQDLYRDKRVVVHDFVLVLADDTVGWVLVGEFAHWTKVM